MVIKFNLYKEEEEKKGLSFLDDDDFNPDAGGGGADVKTPEEIEAERVEAERVAAEANKNKTPEEIEAERVAAEAEANKDKTPEEIAAEKKAADEAADNDGFELESLIPDAAEDIDVELPEGFDLNAFSLELGMELPEGTTVKTKDEFKSLYQQHLENSKSVVKFDIGEYGDEATELAEFLSNDGSLKDFLDPLKEYNVFLGMNKTDAMMAVYQAQNMSEEEARTKVDELEENENLDKEYKKVQTNVLAARDQAASEIMKKGDAIATTRSSKAEVVMKAEQDKLIEVINSTEKFLDIPLSDNERAKLVSHVKNGAFFKKFEDPAFFVQAYLQSVIGNKVSDYYSDVIAEARRQGFNVADIKSKKRLRTDPNRSGGAGSENASTSVGFSKLDG